MQSQVFIKSSFLFKNGLRITVHTIDGISASGNGIRSYRCDENWQQEAEPFAPSPHWFGSDTAESYHLFIRGMHAPDTFVQEQSTVLTKKP